jgi:hypothetical protein
MLKSFPNGARIVRVTDEADLGRPGALQESEDAFYSLVVLTDADDAVTTGTAIWAKVRFESWWDERNTEFEPSLDIPAAAALPPAPTAPSCADDTWTPTGGASPARRYQHAAVWTGSEMIVWGGWGDSSLVNTGGRYNPATDTWLPMNIIGAPSRAQQGGRGWTGTRMVVWGGSTNAGDTNTGGRYDPVFDTWTPMTTTGAPTARMPRIAVWTGSKLVVWGGDLLPQPAHRRPLRSRDRHVDLDHADGGGRRVRARLADRRLDRIARDHLAGRAVRPGRRRVDAL